MAAKHSARRAYRTIDRATRTGRPTGRHEATSDVEASEPRRYRRPSRKATRAAAITASLLRGDWS